MVASRKVEVSFHKSFGRRRGRGFVALAQVIGKTSIQFLLKNVVPAAERVGGDSLEIAVPEMAEVVSKR